MPLINPAPQQTPVDSQGRISQPWATFFDTVFKVLTALTNSGTTAQRPTVFLWVGRPYFDTTLGKPIWFKNPGWVDATGAPA